MEAPLKVQISLPVRRIAKHKRRIHPFQKSTDHESVESLFHRLVNRNLSALTVLCVLDVKEDETML